jgi:hypothetical protein
MLHNSAEDVDADRESKWAFQIVLGAWVGPQRHMYSLQGESLYEPGEHELSGFSIGVVRSCENHSSDLSASGHCDVLATRSVHCGIFTQDGRINVEIRSNEH